MKLNLLTNKFPQERELINRVDDLISSRSGRYTELSLDQLISWSNHSSTFKIAELIQNLVDQGVFEKIIRLEINDTAIKDYKSLSEVPAIEYDYKNDVNVEVKPEDLRIYYKLKT